MTQEHKQLLLKDLCARLPYGLFCQTDDGKGKLISVECSFGDDLVYVDFGYPEAKEYDLNEGDSVKPYLRPMSSMTDEEWIKFYKWANCRIEKDSGEIGSKSRGFGEGYEYLGIDDMSDAIDWLNAHHFDYRGLIEKELALEAPEDMYNYENN